MSDEYLKHEDPNAGKQTPNSDQNASESQPGKRQRSRWRSILTVIMVIAVILLGIFSRIDNWKRDLTTNYARLDSQASDEDLRPLQLAESPKQVADRIEEWVEKESKWQVMSRRETEKGLEMDLIRTTGLMRFTDDINVHLDASEGGTHVRAESQSRVGKGDLGQNPRNLKELVSVLKSSR